MHEGTTEISRRIVERTRTYKNKLQDKKYRAKPLQEVLRERVRIIRNQDLDNQGLDSYNLLHTLDWALSQPELVEPLLLASYITELTRLMENAGAGRDFRRILDKAIDFYQTTEQSVLVFCQASIDG